jgi:LPS export ABC transporter protein LptC/lipopolysaccharide transport protein LptA
MTPATTRTLRHGLLVLVAAVVAAVGWSIRKPEAPPTAVPTPEPGAGAAGTSVGELVFRRFKGESEGFVLKARKMVGQEGDDTHFQEVEVQISYVARGEPGKATVTAKACRVTAGQERAVFQGSVHLSTEDGFELDTETLIYNGNKGVAKTAEPVRFRRKGLSGTSTGLEYRAEDGGLELAADVFLRIEDEKGPKTEVRARSAQGGREEHALRFLGDVDVVQGNDSLKAQRLNLTLDEDLTAVYRAVAVDDVVLSMSGGVAMPGAAGTPKAKGPRVLKAKKLDLWFREDRTIKEATAGPDADLLVRPGPGEPRENRRIQARVLAFHFDDAGRIVEMQAQREVAVTAEPVPPAKGPARTVTSGTLLATFDPETGEARQVDFEKGTEFKEGSRLARGGRARYEGERGVLVLQQGPSLTDEADGTELQAQGIEITGGTGDVAARGTVRHTRRAKATPGRKGFLSGEDAPVVIVSENLDYAAKGRRATYTGKALLRSGKDEVRGDTLVLEEPGPEARRLVATGEVASILNPRPKADGKKPPAAVEGRAKEMVYEEARREIVYNGDVTMRQGDIRTRSPKATLTLSADGRDLETLVAGEPAAIEQGPRKASGARATYTPATETVVIVGDKVVLEDPGQKVEGRTLTFHVGDDKILVDGQEQVRTEAVIRREPRTP